MYQDALQTPVRAPYLTHMVQRGAINKLRFCPYEVGRTLGLHARPAPALLPGAHRRTAPGLSQPRPHVAPHMTAAAWLQDVLGVGHAGGVSTMLVPGAGEPNYDSRVADPFQGRKARREQEVHRLLDKLQPDMIVMDPSTIGQVGAVGDQLWLRPPPLPPP